MRVFYNYRVTNTDNQTKIFVKKIVFVPRLRRSISMEKQASDFTEWNVLNSKRYNKPTRCARFGVRTHSKDILWNGRWNRKTVRWPCAITACKPRRFWTAFVTKEQRLFSATMWTREFFLIRRIVTDVTPAGRVRKINPNGLRDFNRRHVIAVLGEP